MERYRLNPTLILRDAGMEPDPWQADLLCSKWSRALLNCSRQSGKSQLAAADAIFTAMDKEDQLVLLLSPTLRQCFDADSVVLSRDGSACRICNHPDAWQTGTRPVKRITVWGGASITVTDNHPIWKGGKVGSEWVPAGELAVGDSIAMMSEWQRWRGDGELVGRVPRGRRSSGKTEEVRFPVTEDLGKLLGYLMTDGCHGQGEQNNIKFSSRRKAYLDECEQLAMLVTGVPAKRYGKAAEWEIYFTQQKRTPGLCLDCGEPLVKRDKQNTGPYYGRCLPCGRANMKRQTEGKEITHINRMLDLMRVIRWDNMFPTDLFNLSANVVAAAINRAWAGDGCVRVNKNGFPEVFLACENEIHARYFQLLLLKFGIRSRVNQEWPKKATKWFYRLLVNAGRLNVERFFATVGLIFGKEKNSQAALDCGRTGRNRVIDYFPDDHSGEDGEVFSMARIISIEDVGERPVYDITVPGKGWLVAGGIKAHNSGELFRDKLMKVYNRIGRPVAALSDTALTLTLRNGSRIISLPGAENTIQGYSSVNLLVIDEAARVPDALYASVRPMLAVSKGRLLAMSTPFGKRGWFYKAWEADKQIGAVDPTFFKENWKRVRVTADQCPRITTEFLEEEYRDIGERWFRQEYLTEFTDIIGQMISGDVIDRSFQDMPTLFEEMGIKDDEGDLFPREAL